MCTVHACGPNVTGNLTQRASIEQDNVTQWLCHNNPANLSLHAREDTESI